MYRIIVEGDDTSIVVLIDFKHRYFRHIDGEQLRKMKFNAKKSYVSTSTSSVRLEYDLDVSVDVIQQDIAKIVNYFRQKYDPILERVNELRNALGAYEPVKVCPLTGQKCMENCVFYEWKSDRCTVLTIEVYCER